MEKLILLELVHPVGENGASVRNPAATLTMDDAQISIFWYYSGAAAFALPCPQ